MSSEIILQGKNCLHTKLSYNFSELCITRTIKITKTLLYVLYYNEFKF